ncbi:MAG: hypothetical protein Q8K71_08355 [Polaromonas sp.]|nr:hypothetical protein [Polaromonas sp.]MDP3753555.1 hypothetical protein [Polaromonas sp.]
MNDLYDAATGLVIAGLSVGFTMLWLRHLSRLHRQNMDQLLALREALHEDLLGTLVRHQRTLAKLGLLSIDWRGNWYGTPVFTRMGPLIPSNVHGGPPGPDQNDAARFDEQVLSQSFQYDDISLEFRVGLKGLRGERRLFAIQAAEVLFAMLQGALAGRQLALAAAVSQRARVGVFLQHDMRNLAQWVQLVAEDFGSAETDSELMTKARRLRSNALLAAERAHRMTQALLNPAWQASVSAPATTRDDPDAAPMLDLDEHILQAGQLHQVEIDLQGGAWLTWDAAALATVLDNVLGNVSNLSRERIVAARCRVVVAQEGQHIVVHFETPDLPLEIPLDKLFEPWASSGTVNKGLGMYQARKQAQLAGGDLYAERMGKGLRVTLRVPCKTS